VSNLAKTTQSKGQDHKGYHDFIMEMTGEADRQDAVHRDNSEEEGGKDKKKKGK